MQLSDYTLALLDDIERRIDPEVEEDFAAQWRTFWDGKYDRPIFTPMRKKTNTPGVEVRNIHINDAIGDLSLMLDMQLADLSKRLSSANQALGIRSNYGTGIMTTLFGAEIFMMPREAATLPTTRSLNDSDAVRRILEAGMPSLTGGFGKDVFAFGEMCAEIFKNYPKIQRYVSIFHPDTQGPLDIAELLWGSEMFYEMYDDPDFVHGVLRLITDTYKAFLDRWYTIIPRTEGISTHWNWMHAGTIMLRNDSAMNLSPEMYSEFAFPYDNELLNYYGGGCVHYCGRGDHYIRILCGAPLLKGINLSQPHLNDMDEIFSAVRDNGKKILGLRANACSAYAARPDAVCGMIHQI